MTGRAGLVLMLLVAVGSWATPAAAQQPASFENAHLYASRDSLQALLQRYQLAARSTAYSKDLRARAQADAERVQARLENGDFQVGDRILLTVEGEQALSDTFTVQEGPQIVLPTIGSVPLHGVLRTELKDYLTQFIAKYIRDPVVHARTLIRILVAGDVAQPNYYLIPSEALITDAVARAGGPREDAKLQEMSVQRANKELIDPDELQSAILASRTLDELGLQTGDQIVVPGPSRGLGGAESTVRVITYILGIPLAIYGITRIF